MYYTTINGIRQVTSGAYSPVSPGQTTVGKQPYEEAMSGNFGIQQNVGFDTVLDVSYVTNLRRHTRRNRNVNKIPKFSRYDPANRNPWDTFGRSLDDNYQRPYTGYGTINMGKFDGSTYYHSLQVSVRRSFRRGFSYGVSYTWSKTMGYNIFNDFPDYLGKRQEGIPQVLVFNYIYEVPGLGRRLDNKFLGAITDGWTISGINRFQHGGWTTPSFSWTGTSATVIAPEMTGSADGARLVLLKNPELPKEQRILLKNPELPKEQRTFWKQFDTTAFMPPYPCSLTNKTDACFGNIGYNILALPGINNWDMTFSKNIPLGLGEGRSLRFRAEMYNIFNHTQFSGMDTSAEFNVTTRQQTDPNFGRFTSARAPRQMSFSLRFEF